MIGQFDCEAYSSDPNRNREAPWHASLLCHAVSFRSAQFRHTCNQSHGIHFEIRSSLNAFSQSGKH